MWELVSVVRWPLLGGLAVIVGFAVLVNLVTMRFVPDWFAGLLTGLFAATVGSGLWFRLLTVKGQQNKYLGAEAERDTARELSSLDDLTVFHDIVLRRGDSTWNVDHVVVGRCQVFAIETKYKTPTKRGLSDGGKDQAIESARDIRRRILANSGPWIDVRPVVALWGGPKTQPATHMVDKVCIARGDSLSDWLRAEDSGPPLSPQIRDDAIKRLQKLNDDDDARTRAAEPVHPIVEYGPNVFVESTMFALGTSVVVVLGLQRLPLAPVIWLALFAAGAITAHVARGRMVPSRLRVWLFTAEIVWSIFAGALLVFLISAFAYWQTA
jgi:hypothetical protein